MQTGNFPDNSHKQFYVILNNNQIKRYTYTELLNKNNLNLKGYHNPDTFWTLIITFLN